MDRSSRRPRRGRIDAGLRLRGLADPFRRFDLQGHRGARALYPENTLEGFRAALRLGLGALELDIGVTGDGVPVAHHDPALNPGRTRGPDGAWLAGRPPLLRDLPYAELAAYDVGRARPGSVEALRFRACAALDGARVPTLKAVLRLAPPPRLTIELKLFPDRPGWTVPPEEMVDRVLAAVDLAGAAGRVTLQSFDWRAVRYLGRIRPEIARAYLTAQATEAARALWWGTRASSLPVPRAVAAEGGGTWSPAHARLTRDEVREAQALGLRVVPWTVNRAADMRRLIGWGVDGLITDRPDRGLALLGAAARA